MKKKVPSNKPARSASTALNHLKRRARQMTPDEWSRAAKQLARDLAAEQLPAHDLTHVECEEALPWYVGDEQRGKNVRELYPAVWQHLQMCRSCTESYEFLAETPRRTGTAPSPFTRTSLPHLAFLGPQPYATWFKQQEPRQLGKQATTFLFNPVHLQALSFNRPAANIQRAGDIRREGAVDDKLLLLSDEIEVADQTLAVVAWLVPTPETPGRFQIHLAVHSREPLKTNLRAQLHWGEKESMRYLSAGETIFEDILPPDFAKSYKDIPSPEFRLILEAAENAAEAS